MEELAKKKILITGVSGLLGNNLAFFLKKDYIVLGLYNDHYVSIEGIKTQHCDLTDERSIKEILDLYRPDIIVHCAALSNIDICEVERSQAYQSNIVATRNILNSIKQDYPKFVYVSTDNLYAKNGGVPLDENSSLEVVNYYGETKLEGEMESLKYGNALILRTNIFGFNIQDKYSLSEWIVHELKSKKPIQGFTDSIFSSIYTFDFANVLKQALDRGLKGIYNLGCRTHLSKYDFAVKIAGKFDLDETLIEPISVDEYGLKAKRQKYLVLNVGKLESELGMQMPTLEESIDHYYKDYSDGVPDQIKGCIYPKEDCISYGQQSIDENDILAVTDVLKSSNLTQGEKVREFESDLKKITGAKFCVAVNTGTSALHLTCLAIGIEKGDEVITSPNSFIASANCVMYCGGTPVFADIDPLTYNISCEEIEKKITSRTKAIIPVHFAGQSCPMEEIRALADKKSKQFGTKIYLIEDAAHALGSQYKGKNVGACAYSDMSIMSFHPVKHITTGEGGAVFTNDKNLYRSLKFLSSHGITSDPSRMSGDNRMAKDKSGTFAPWYYEQQFLGYNFRITDIQCALGISQLKKIHSFMKRRREIVNYYNESFRDTHLLTIPYQSEDCDSNWHLYVLKIDFEQMKQKRSDLILSLREEDRIWTQVHYIPIHTQPYYQKTFGYKWGDFPITEKYYTQCLSIPLFPSLRQSDVERVVNIFQNIGKR